MSRSATITVVTANIGRGVSTEEAHANIHKVAQGFRGAFVGFQEIDEADAPDEAALVATRFPVADPVEVPQTGMHDDLAATTEGTYAFAGFSGPGWKRATPIAVPTTWDVVQKSVVTSSDGLAHVSPNRVIVAARCRPVDDPDFPPVVFLNGHYPLARTPVAKELWKACQASWVERVGELHGDAESGCTIITTRDTNKHGRMPGPQAGEAAAASCHRPHQRHPRPSVVCEPGHRARARPPHPEPHDRRPRRAERQPAPHRAERLTRSGILGSCC